MGISMGAMLIVGLPFDEVEGAYAFVDDDKLQYASTCYDSNPDERIVGVEVSRVYYEAKEIDLSVLGVDVFIANNKFRDITGKIGKLYLSTHIT